MSATTTGTSPGTTLGTTMRIALTCNNYPPEFAGGTERVVRAMARELAAAGDHVVIVAGSELPGPAAGAGWIREDDGGIPVYRVRRTAAETYGLDLERPRVLAAIAGVLRREAIDVQHVHHWSHLSDRQVQHARAAGIPSVVTLHDLWTTCPRFFRLPPAGITCPQGKDRGACAPCVDLDLNGAAGAAARAIVERDEVIAGELAAASAIAVPSAATARAAAEHLRTRAADAVVVIPHGLLDAVPAAPRGPRGPLGLPLRVGTFGNLNREKGVLDLVAAMAGVRAELHLFGAATAAFRAEAEAAAAAHRIRTFWHGGFDAAGAHPASRLDLAVFPSRCRETYGLVVDEALHHGTPVIVADSGALPERVAAGGGLTVPAGRVDELAAAIRGLVEDRDAYHLLRASIPTTFPTIAAAVETYRHLYVKAWAARTAT